MPIIPPSRPERRRITTETTEDGWEEWQRLLIITNASGNADLLNIMMAVTSTLYDCGHPVGYYDAETDTFHEYVLPGREPKPLLTPEEFAQKMAEIWERDDTDGDIHKDSDDLMTDLLASLGYGEGARIHRKATKWFE